MKVSAIRFPDMEQKGDVTKINGAEIASVDVVTFGSPCTRLSVAGKHDGFDITFTCITDEEEKPHYTDKIRATDKYQYMYEDVCPVCGKQLIETNESALFFHAIRIIREMREHEKQLCGTTINIRPRFMLWENVPGAFSSNKGEDFRSVLEETAKIADETIIIPGPPKGKWPTVGCIMGNGWSIAWRILDAQYWGVPQRRRRIFLVADFGGQSAPEVLFKREGLRRHLAESRETREGIVANIEGSTGKAIGFSGKNSASLNMCPSEELSPTLRSGAETHVMTSTFDFGRVSDRIEINPSVSVTLKGTGGGGGAKTGLYCMATKQISQNIGIDVAMPIMANDYKEPQIVCAGFCTEHSAQSRGIGYQEECSPTLRKDVTPAVMAFTQNQREEVRDLQDKAGALAAEPGVHQQTYVAQIPLHDPSPTMANSHPGSYLGQDACADMFVAIPDKAHCLSKQPQLKFRDDMDTLITQHYSVRRLTPLECERLQDYEDGWTDIPGASDSGRYKALGNSVAVCCPEYVLEGIAEQLRNISAGGPS
jgi:DNA (cytosine-5)-methyltransferase 1